MTLYVLSRRLFSHSLQRFVVTGVQKHNFLGLHYCLDLDMLKVRWILCPLHGLQESCTL